MTRTPAPSLVALLLLASGTVACGSDGGGPADACGLGDTLVVCGTDVPDAVDAGRDTTADTGRDATVPDEGATDVPATDVPPADAPADTPAADLPPADEGPADAPANDVPAPDAGTDEGPAPTPVGRLTVNCDVPGVLDASKAGDMLYMTSHFGDLVQQWGITGTVAGVDLTAFPEKMYYGTHPVDEAYLTLTQASMTDGLQPVYSVRIDFVPDSAVTAGSAWGVGLEDGQAVATVVKHNGTSSLCVLAMGLGGTLTFAKAAGVTQVEGGSFAVSGAFDVVDPHDVAGVCESLGAGGCCP